MDNFKACKYEEVKLLAQSKGIQIVEIPPNFTHLMSPLDLTVNRKLMYLEQEDFSKDFSNAVTRIMVLNPNIDVADIRVDCGH